METRSPNYWTAREFFFPLPPSASFLIDLNQPALVLLLGTIVGLTTWLYQPRSSRSSAAAAKSLQSCPTLCDPRDGSPPGSPVPGILQATLEWVAISFSNAWKGKVKVKSLSRVRLLATPWTVAHQAPPSMGFSRQEYWSGVPLPSPLDPLGRPNDQIGQEIYWSNNSTRCGCIAKRNQQRAAPRPSQQPEATTVPKPKGTWEGVVPSPRTQILATSLLPTQPGASQESQYAPALFSSLLFSANTSHGWTQLEGRRHGSPNGCNSTHSHLEQNGEWI